MIYYLTICFCLCASIKLCTLFLIFICISFLTILFSFFIISFFLVISSLCFIIYVFLMISIFCILNWNVLINRHFVSFILCLLLTLRLWRRIIFYEYFLNSCLVIFRQHLFLYISALYLDYYASFVLVIKNLITFPPFV